MAADHSTLLDALPALVWTTQSDGRAKFVNNRWRDFTGLATDIATGFGWQKAVHPDDLAAILTATLEGAAAAKIEGRLRRHDGEYRRFVFHRSRFPGISGGGSAWCWLGIEADASSVSQEAPVVRNDWPDPSQTPDSSFGMEALLQLFFEQAPLSMFIKDLLGRYVLINAQAEKLFSATNQSVRGLPVDAFYPAELAAAVHSDDSRVLHSHDIVRHEWLIPTGSESRWFAANKFAIRNHAGEPVGIGGVDADIHEQKRLEAALREAGLLLRAVIDAVPAVIAVRDTNGRFVLVNRAFADLIGVVPDGCVGKTPIEIGGWQITERLLGMQLPMSADGQWGKFCEAETRLVEGEPRVWLTNSVPVFAATGGVSHIVSVAIDITMRKRAEDAIVEAKEAAERANLAKSRFLASASHDIRQPLQALGLFVNALERRVRSGSGRVILRDVRDCLDAMGHLLNALLDISQLEAGTILPKSENVRLQMLFDQLSREYLPIAREKGLELRFVGSGAVVRSDPTLLRTIIANFLANAIRYTASGRIVLGCRRIGDDSVSIEVHDTGIGIAADSIDRIFDDFYQVRGAAADRCRGLGLGLAIAQRLARLLGHTIAVRSCLDRGSSFTLSALPIADESETSEAEPMPANRRSLAKRRVLILENDPVVARALVTILRDWGAAPAEADTIDGALTIAAAQPPDVVIADYQLDDGATGLAGLAAIEQKLGHQLPAIILSGDMAREDLRSMRYSGYYTLSKPVQPGRLRALLDICLAATVSRRSEEPPRV